MRQYHILLKNNKVGFLTIVGDPGVVEPCMFGKGVYFYVFYFLCCAMDISTEVSEDHVEEERDPDLDE